MNTPTNRERLLRAQRYLILLGLAGGLGPEAFARFDLRGALRATA